MKIVRALVAAAVALAIGVTVQAVTSSPASATGDSGLCWSCWGNTGR